MKPKKIFLNSIVCAGIFTVLLTGCIKAFSKEYKSNSADGGITENLSETKELQEVQKLELKNNSEDQSNLMKGEDVKNQEFIDAAVNDFKSYFGVTVNTSEYEMEVTYLEAYEDIEASYVVMTVIPENIKILADPNNIGLDGYPTKEAKKKLKPEFYAVYNEEKVPISLNLSNVYKEDLKIPMTIEESKKAAKKFIESNHLVAGETAEFIHANVVSDSRMFILFKNGEEGAIGIGVNTFSSKVEDFQYMTNEKAKILSTPIEEGSGIG